MVPIQVPVEWKALSLTPKNFDFSFSFIFTSFFNMLCSMRLMSEPESNRVRTGFDFEIEIVKRTMGRDLLFRMTTLRGLNSAGGSELRCPFAQSEVPRFFVPIQ